MTYSNFRPWSLNATPISFNSFTNIEFFLEEKSEIFIDIYNTSGQNVKTVISGKKYNPGDFSVIWDINRGKSINSGIYFVKMVAKDIQTGRILYFNTIRVNIIR